MFHLSLACIVAAIFFKGFGNQIFGLTLSNNVSIYFIYIVFLFQLMGASYFRVPKELLWLLAAMATHTFVLNYSPLTFVDSLVHLLGVAIISITTFTFVFSNNFRILHIIRLYYYFAFFAACFAIFQVLLFVLNGYSFHLQEIFDGPELIAGRLNPDIFDLLPRASGFSLEPAHFVLILLPGVFIALLVLMGKASVLKFGNRITALTIILGLLLTFSLVGYFALALSIIISFSHLKLKAFTSTFLIVMVVAGGVVSQFPQMIVKLNTFINVGSALSGYDFTSNDLSGFAIISNAMVAKEALLDSYLLGTGLKTHEYSYYKYLYNYFTYSQVLHELNAIDAGSLFIRLISEFGLFGITGFLFFLGRCKIVSNQEASLLYIVNSMSFIAIAVYSLRNGSYLDPFLWLFVALYYYSYIASKPSSVRNSFESLVSFKMLVSSTK